MTEEQKARLQELPSAPVEEPVAKERLNDRRREGKPGRNKDDPGDDEGPGQTSMAFLRSRASNRRAGPT